MSSKPEKNNKIGKVKKVEPTPQEKIPYEVAEVLESLPEEKREILMTALSVVSQHEGPLPDAYSIRTYNEVIPNGGDRLMKTVEKQVDHRIELESKGLKRSFNQSATGQFMAFFIAIIVLLIAWDLGRTGNQMAAAILGAFNITGLVTVFVVGKRSNK